ncbi:MAG: DUF4862 family protein [Elusimicrobia bacterium]|nr:DUF4862 family protein [Elusimicrobiota bacterium]
MKIYVSSYAAASPALPWNRDAEAALFKGFAESGLAGLELPFTGSLHAHDEGWLASRLQAEWNFIVTLLPGTMNRLKDAPSFGPASADQDGRRRALDFAEDARRAVLRLNARLGRKAVAAVSLHSAPRLGGSGARSSLEGFAASLTELRGRDWDGAELLVEHCDAAVPSHAPDKGFLRIEDECAAIKLSSGPTPAGMLINWGRSAIETRSAEGPLDHIRRAREAGLLRGLFFSGATPDHPDYGAWKDSHAPFATSCAASILTPAAAKTGLAESGTIDYLGLKIQPLPATMGTAERLGIIRGGLDALKT